MERWKRFQIENLKHGEGDGDAKRGEDRASEWTADSIADVGKAIRPIESVISVNGGTASILGVP